MCNIIMRNCEHLMSKTSLKMNEAHPTTPPKARICLPKLGNRSDYIACISDNNNAVSVEVASRFLLSAYHIHGRMVVLDGCHGKITCFAHQEVVVIKEALWQQTRFDGKAHQDSVLTVTLNLTVDLAATVVWREKVHVRKVYVAHGTGMSYSH